MELLIDNLSKQLAKTTSRRSMLSIASRTLFASFVTSTGIGKLLAQTSELPGDIGSSSCGAVQQAVQLAFRDLTKFSNHGTYVSSVARSVSAAQNVTLITNDCSGCIVSQFARGVSVDQQESCGSIVPPTNACSSATATDQQQAQTASVLALVAVPDAWSDPQQFHTFLYLVQSMLGCMLGSTVVPPPQSQSDAAPSAAVPVGIGNPTLLGSQTIASTVFGGAVGSCKTPSVNYCGPGNSLENSKLSYISYPDCLNAACAAHDNCYGEQCPPIAFECYFTKETAGCDAPLLQTCQGNGACTAPQLNPSDPLQALGLNIVCSSVECLTASLPQNTLLGSICINSFEQRSSAAQCQTTTSQCLNCFGVGEACGTICCPCGQSCVNGSCTCAPGQSFCATVGSLASTCCPVGTICSDGSCITCSAGTTPCGGAACCSSGETCCGTTCCSTGQTCSNGTCVFGCPSGETPCGTTCCSSSQYCSSGACVACPSGTISCGTFCCPSFNPICCTLAFGTPACIAEGRYCCPYGNCPVGTTCCGLAIGTNGASSNACCEPGQTCVIVPGQVAFCSG